MTLFSSRPSSPFCPSFATKQLGAKVCPLSLYKADGQSVPRLPPPPPPTHKRRHYYNTQSQGRLCIILTPIFPSITRVRTPKFDPKGLLKPISVKYLFSKRPSLRPKAENRVGFVGKSRPPFYSATASRGSSREVFCVPP